MGVRDASGWRVLAQTPKMMKGDTFYNLLVTVNGTVATLLVDNSAVFTYTFAPRVIDGVQVALNKGMVGMGSDDARGMFDNVAVQILPPQVTYDGTSNLTTGTNQLGNVAGGTWTQNSSGYTGTAAADGTQAVVPVNLGGVKRLGSTSWLEVTTKVATSGIAGLAFDMYSTTELKFAAIDVPHQRVVLGHLDPRSHAWVVDASYAQALTAGRTYSLMLTLKGASASVTLDGAYMTSFGFNAGVSDGRFGLYSHDTPATFTTLRVRSDDGQLVGITAPNDPPPVVVPTISVGDVTVNEGSSGTSTATVTVTLSQATTVPVTVPWTLVPGTATYGSDYSGATSGSLTFAAGVTSMVVLVTIVGDTVVEPDEAFTFQVGTPTGATVTKGTGTVTIKNDDLAPPTLSISSGSVSEGKSGVTTSATLTVTLSRAMTSTVSVVVNLSTLGTATSGTDFRFTNVTLSFAAGTTSKTVTISVLGDNTKEADETVVLQLGSPSGATVATGTGTLTIVNDDPALVATSTGPGTTSRLAPGQVRATLARAIAYWRSRGVAAAALSGIRVAVVPMDGDRLGQSVGRVLHVDADAAGWGWSTGTAVRPGRIDLLSVLVHEIGHVLGREHTVGGPMAAELAPGVRTVVLPTTGAVTAPTRARAVGSALAVLADPGTARALPVPTVSAHLPTVGPVLVRLGAVPAGLAALLATRLLPVRPPAATSASRAVRAPGSATAEAPARRLLLALLALAVVSIRWPLRRFRRAGTVRSLS
jgi:hypothetical protein